MPAGTSMQHWHVCFQFLNGDAWDAESGLSLRNAMMRKKPVLAIRPSIHPCNFLAEILDENGISQAQFSRMIGVSPMRVSHVINGTTPVTAELVLLFVRAFRQTPQHWLNLQSAYDLRMAQSKIGTRLRQVETPVA